MRRTGAALFLCLGLACGGLPPVQTGPAPGQEPFPEARVVVEVWRGFPEPVAAPTAGPPAVEILLDLTSSMQTRVERQPPRYMAAREAAARLVEGLPGQTPVRVRALGISRGATCEAPTRVGEGSAQRVRGRLPGHLRALRPNSEGSLAAALEGLANEPDAVLEDTRVVVYTDLGDECGGDLCAAGAALAAAGARLDFVLFGEAPEPECFASFAPAHPPRAAAALGPPPSPGFEVVRDGTDPEQRGAVLGRGRAHGSAVFVPTGPALIVVDLEPKAYIGPIRLPAGSLTRVRVLDFPGLDPPVREWGWESIPTDGPLAEGNGSTDAPKAATHPVRRAVAQPG